MAIKLAGTPGSSIGNAPLTTNVSGGFINVATPKVLPNAMIKLGQAGQGLADTLNKVDKKLQAERDEATLMNAQNEINKMKHGMRADWSTQGNGNYAMGINANKTWADGQTIRMKNILDSLENGTFKMAGVKDQQDNDAFNEALTELGPAGKLALRKYLINQQDSWVSNLTSHQIQQTKIGVAAAAETSIAYQDQVLLQADIGNVGTVLLDTLDLIDKKNVAIGVVSSKSSSISESANLSTGESVETAVNNKVEAQFSSTRFDPANMIEINDKVNALIPDKIRNYLNNGQVDLARNLLEKYKRYELQKGNADGIVKLTQGNYAKLSSEVDAVNESVWINATTNTVTQDIAFQEADTSILSENGTTAKYKQFDIVKVGKKLDDLVGTPIMEMNDAGLMVPSDRRYTDADVKKLKARAAEMHTRNATDIKTAREELMERLTARITADPTNPVTSLDTNGLLPNQIRNIRAFQDKEAGLSIANRPLVTDDPWLVKNFWSLTQAELANKDASWFNDTVLKHVKNGDETSLVSAWRTANANNVSKQADAARLDNTFNDNKAKVINDASFKIYQKNLNSRLAIIQDSFPKSEVGKARGKRVVESIRAVALQEFYERQNVENSKTIITENDADAIIDTVVFKLVGNREGDNIEGTRIEEITIGQILSAPIQITANSSKKEKDIAKAQEVFTASEIPQYVQFEVSNAYMELHAIFSRERGIVDEDGVATAPTFKGLADFVKSTEIFVQKNVNSTDNVFQKAVDNSHGVGAWATASPAAKKQYIYGVINKTVIGNSSVSGSGDDRGTVSRSSTLRAEDKAVFQAIKAYMSISPAFAREVQ